MNNNVKISLVTTCKGRLSYLRESLPTWLDLDYDNYEIIVTDYDCPDGTEAYVNENRELYRQTSKARDVRVVKVHDKPYFNLNDARNTGADAASGALIFMIDSDVHIRDKGLLKKIDLMHRDGVVFTCNPAVLTTNYLEGPQFYRFKYGVTVPFHAFLPCHCKDSGLTGTACFVKDIYTACGKYDAEINKAGWGSDDIEFYLRYLNHYFYHVFLKKQAPPPGGLSDEAVSTALDRAAKKIITFHEGTFRLFENTEEEKEKNYPNPKQKSIGMNKQHIVRFFDTTNIEEHDPRGYIPRRHGPAADEKSILKYGRYKKFPLPPWFRYWYLHWAGVAFYNNAEYPESMQSFKEVLKIKNAPPYYYWHSLFFIALIRKQQNQKDWKTYYKKGLTAMVNLRYKSELEKYNIASFFKSFGDHAEAEKIFKRLAAGARETQLRAGACFHLGEIAHEQKKFPRAAIMFEQTLRFNPHHQKAAQYLEEIQTSQHSKTP